MHPAFIARFTPAGPWRIGPDSGSRLSCELVMHSDAVYSAVTMAMSRLGLLEQWTESVLTADGPPAVRFSSMFPFWQEYLLVPPPAHIWPPPPSTRLRWKSARLIPLLAAQAILAGETLLEAEWKLDGISQCLLPASAEAGPFRRTYRTMAAVDRLGAGYEAYGAACVEFGAGSGMWVVASFANEEAKSRWEAPVKAALRLLADSGIGGRRSTGWGTVKSIEFEDGDLLRLLLSLTLEVGAVQEEAENEHKRAWWLLSVYFPSASDSVDWRAGKYGVIERKGRVDGSAGTGQLKRATRMVTEGSVLIAPTEPSGRVVDITPDGCPHPVYRVGYGLALPVAWSETAK